MMTSLSVVREHAAMIQVGVSLLESSAECNGADNTIEITVSTRAPRRVGVLGCYRGEPRIKMSCLTVVDGRVREVSRRSSIAWSFELKQCRGREFIHIYPCDHITFPNLCMVGNFFKNPVINLGAPPERLDALGLESSRIPFLISISHSIFISTEEKVNFT